MEAAPVDRSCGDLSTGMVVTSCRELSTSRVSTGCVLGRQLLWGTVDQGPIPWTCPRSTDHVVKCRQQVERHRLVGRQIMWGIVDEGCVPHRLPSSGPILGRQILWGSVDQGCVPQCRPSRGRSLGRQIVWGSVDQGGVPPYSFVFGVWSTVRVGICRHWRCPRVVSGGLCGHLIDHPAIVPCEGRTQPRSTHCGFPARSHFSKSATSWARVCVKRFCAWVGRGCG